MALKLKIKRTLLKRKVDGAVKEGYYGRVITTGKKMFDDIVKDAGKNTTMHKAELKMAGELLLDSIADGLKEGYIVDLGPLGTLYPAVNGTWKEDAKDLQLSEMKPKVNYKASDDISAAVKGASLSWASDTETEENASPADDEQTGGGDNGGGSGENEE